MYKHFVWNNYCRLYALCNRPLDTIIPHIFFNNTHLTKWNKIIWQTLWDTIDKNLVRWYIWLYRFGLCTKQYLILQYKLILFTVWWDYLSKLSHVLWLLKLENLLEIKYSEMSMYFSVWTSGNLSCSGEGIWMYMREFIAS